MRDVTTVRLCECELPMSKGDNFPSIYKLRKQAVNDHNHRQHELSVVICFYSLKKEKILLLTRAYLRGKFGGRVTHNKPVVGKKDQAYRK